MKRILYIFSILSCFYVVILKADGCRHCGTDIVDACSHCPSCGFPVVVNSLLSHNDIHFDTQQRVTGFDENFITPGFLRINLIATLSAKRLKDNDVHKSLREAVHEAKTEGRQSALWEEIKLYCSIYYQTDAYVQLVRAISLRYLGQLKDALQLLLIFISDNGILSYKHIEGSPLQMLYEAAFDSYLLKNYEYAVVFYYHFFIHRDLGGVRGESVQNAIHSARIILSTDSLHKNALLLIRLCWSKFKSKISAGNTRWFRSEGFQ